MTNKASGTTAIRSAVDIPNTASCMALVSRARPIRADTQRLDRQRQSPRAHE